MAEKYLVQEVVEVIMDRALDPVPEDTESDSGESKRREDVTESEQRPLVAKEVVEEIRVKLEL